jgi:hypothetical protein
MSSPGTPASPGTGPSSPETDPDDPTLEIFKGMYAMLCFVYCRGTLNVMTGYYVDNAELNSSFSFPNLQKSRSRKRGNSRMWLRKKKRLGSTR